MDAILSFLGICQSKSYFNIKSCRLDLQDEKTQRFIHVSSTHSGNLQALATQQSVSPSTLYNCIKRFEKSAKESTAKRGFHPLELEDIVSEPVAATVRYPSDVDIEWHGKAETIHLLKFIWASDALTHPYLSLYSLS